MPDDRISRSPETDANSAVDASTANDDGRVRFAVVFRFSLLCLLVAAVWSVLFFFPATDTASRLPYPPCPFHALTGMHCAGCGSTRALSCLAHGDLVGAWAKNKLAVLCVPILLWGFLLYGAECFHLPFPRIFVKARWIWALLAVILLFGILRNVPVPPFTSLAPR